jgi:hypothetical protein
MTKTFDEICNGILGEMITAPNQQQQKPNQPGQQPAPAAGAPAAIQNNTQNNAQQPNQMQDDELLKLLQQKLNDEKFKQSLMQLMNPQQPNAAVKPA